jgi:hypothetical protein
MKGWRPPKWGGTNDHRKSAEPVHDSEHDIRPIRTPTASQGVYARQTTICASNLDKAQYMRAKTATTPQDFDIDGTVSDGMKY